MNGVSQEMSNKITCKPRTWREDSRFPVLHWKKALPFVVNPRGLMIHRVKGVRTHLTDDNRISTDYWCGNLGQRCEFYSDPPKERLLCERCEMLATNAGEPPSDELAGRHVHRGKLRAERTCCPHDTN